MDTQEIIIGSKTMLLPLKDYDLDKIVEVHMKDYNRMMGRFCLKDYTAKQARKYIVDQVNLGKLFVWTVYTKEETPMFAGFIYLTDVDNYSVSLHGIMDRDFAKNRKEGGHAYDAAYTLISYCFLKHANRVETDVCASNKLALALDKKLGFIQEGRLRKVVIKDKGCDDLIIMSILKEEWENRNGQRKDAVLQSTATAEAANS